MLLSKLFAVCLLLASTSTCIPVITPSSEYVGAHQDLPSDIQPTPKNKPTSEESINPQPDRLHPSESNSKLSGKAISASYDDAEMGMKDVGLERERYADVVVKGIRRKSLNSHMFTKPNYPAMEAWQRKQDEAESAEEGRGGSPVGKVDVKSGTKGSNDGWFQF